MVDDQGNYIPPRRPIRTSFNTNVINPYNLSGRVAPGYSRPANAPYGYSQYGEPYSAIDRIGVYMDPYMGNLQAGGPQSRPRSSWGSPLGTPNYTDRPQYYQTPSGGIAALAATNDPKKIALRNAMLRNVFVSPEQQQNEYQANYRLGYGQPSLAPQYAAPAGAAQQVGLVPPQRVYQGVEQPYTPTIPERLYNAGVAAFSLPTQIAGAVGNLANTFYNNYVRSRQVASGQPSPDDQMFY